MISETVAPLPLSHLPLPPLPTTSSLPFLPLIMDSFVPALRISIENICKEMEPKYPGMTVDFITRYFHDVHISPAALVHTSPSSSAPASPALGAGAAPKDGRKRVVSKKMTDAFLALAASAGLSEDAAKARFEDVKKAYKVVSDAELESHGGSFDSYARTFLPAGAAAPAPSKPAKEKKEKEKKKESRITKWTPTLTRTLAKLVEDSGGSMTDDFKTSFHSFVDSLDEDTFKSMTMEAHMKRFITDKYVSNAAGGSSSASKTLPSSPAGEEDADEDEEDTEEIAVDGEKLVIGIDSGKLYRPTPAGDVWVGNAGIGRFSGVKIPTK